MRLSTQELSHIWAAWTGSESFPQITQDLVVWTYCFVVELCSCKALGVIWKCLQRVWWCLWSRIWSKSIRPRSLFELDPPAFWWVAAAWSIWLHALAHPSVSSRKREESLCLQMYFEFPSKIKLQFTSSVDSLRFVVLQWQLFLINSDWWDGIDEGRTWDELSAYRSERH